MQNLTSSVYSFEKLRKNDFLYVDKTDYIWNLIWPAGVSYFLSRPRRFGKSLTISTLRAVFEGKRELFRGLAIYDKPYDWKVYPVLNMSFSDYASDGDAVQELPGYLMAKVQQLAAEHHLEITGSTPGLCLGKLIDTLAVNDQVVILVDEYDKPILDNITHPARAAIQKCLRGFFSVLKDREAKERFLLVTGVSKFSHVSLFSDMNNLTDISMNERYATMLGYTQKEFETSFCDWIAAGEGRQSLSHEDFLAKIRSWYDGYKFHAAAETVYNPVSLANFFLDGCQFNNYWFSTGTPEFLLELVKRKNFDFENVLNTPVSSLAFSAYDVQSLDVLPLLLQTGYLTIRDSFQDFGMTFYHLSFPNIEVRSAFDTYLLNAYTGIDRDALGGMAMNMARAVRSGEVADFMETLKSFYAAIPYDIQLPCEKYYQTVFYTLFLVLGVYIEAEARTNNGRMDAVAENGDWVYIFEFKLNQDARTALTQIKEREYYRKYMGHGKNIMLIGVNFDTTQRQISEWRVEELLAM